MTYWLIKSEPNTFSIEDLMQSSNQTTAWEGVRNYQARNFIRAMQVGELAFFYHSSCPIPGIVGIVEIVSTAYPDPTAQDPKSPYYDAKSTAQNPRWYRMDVRFVKKFDHTITLSTLRSHSALHEMIILQKGNRLSVTPVTQQEWHIIEKRS